MVCTEEGGGRVAPAAIRKWKSTVRKVTHCAARASRGAAIKDTSPLLMHLAPKPGNGPTPAAPSHWCQTKRQEIREAIKKNHLHT